MLRHQIALHILAGQVVHQLLVILHVLIKSRKIDKLFAHISAFLYHIYQQQFYVVLQSVHPLTQILLEIVASQLYHTPVCFTHIVAAQCQQIIHVIIAQIKCLPDHLAVHWYLAECQQCHQLLRNPCLRLNPLVVFSIEVVHTILVEVAYLLHAVFLQFIR